MLIKFDPENAEALFSALAIHPSASGRRRMLLQAASCGQAFYPFASDSSGGRAADALGAMNRTNLIDKSYSAF